MVRGYERERQCDWERGEGRGRGESHYLENAIVEICRGPQIF